MKKYLSILLTCIVISFSAHSEENADFINTIAKNLADATLEHNQAKMSEYRSMLVRAGANFKSIKEIQIDDEYYKKYVKDEYNLDASDKTKCAVTVFEINGVEQNIGVCK